MRTPTLAAPLSLPAATRRATLSSSASVAASSSTRLRARSVARAGLRQHTSRSPGKSGWVISARCVKAFMQLVGTREALHQGGRVGALGLAEPRRLGSDRRIDSEVPAQALGVDGVG